MLSSNLLKYVWIYQILTVCYVTHFLFLHDLIASICQKEKWHLSRKMSLLTCGNGKLFNILRRLHGMYRKKHKWAVCCGSYYKVKGNNKTIILVEIDLANSLSSSLKCQWLMFMLGVDDVNINWTF